LIKKISDPELETIDQPKDFVDIVDQVRAKEKASIPLRTIKVKEYINSMKNYNQLEINRFLCNTVKKQILVENVQTKKVAQE
jgi:hypothetical protein